MGAWGTGVFQDDTACDVRDDYRGYLGDGLGGPEATARVLREYESSLADPDESAVVWLALAAAQWRCGRLEPKTLENALNIIDSGSSLLRWQSGSADYGKRRATLAKLRTQLTGPQPPAKKIRRMVLATCDWSIGDLISYRLPSENLILFRVIAHHTDKGGTNPVCELLDWIGKTIPSADELRKLPIRKCTNRPWGGMTRLMLLGSMKAVKGRLQPLEMNLPPEQQRGPSTVILWRELDAKLADWFELR